MEELILHTTTRKQLQSLSAEPSHAVLLTGPNGAGKTAVARTLANELLQLTNKNLDNYPYFKLIEPDEKRTISIDSVRELQNFLRLRTTGGNNVRRLVILKHADRLTKEAQNALLKILEEPPIDTVLIMTASHIQSLLPTILSRVQPVAIRTPDTQAANDFFKERGAEANHIERAYFLAGGLPGLMSALLDETDHPLLASVDSAKSILKQSLFERLCTLDHLSKQKDEANRQIDSLLRIAQAGIKQSVAKQDPSKIKGWHRLRKEALDAKTALSANANAKLVLTKLFLRL